MTPPVSLTAIPTTATPSLPNGSITSGPSRRVAPVPSVDRPSKTPTTVAFLPQQVGQLRRLAAPPISAARWPASRRRPHLTGGPCSRFDNCTLGIFAGVNPPEKTPYALRPQIILRTISAGVSFVVVAPISARSRLRLSFFYLRFLPRFARCTGFRYGRRQIARTPPRINTTSIPITGTMYAKPSMPLASDQSVSRRAQRPRSITISSSSAICHSAKTSNFEKSKDPA